MAETRKEQRTEKDETETPPVTPPAGVTETDEVIPNPPDHPTGVDQSPAPNPSRRGS